MSNCSEPRTISTGETADEPNADIVGTSEPADWIGRYAERHRSEIGGVATVGCVLRDLLQHGLPNGARTERYVRDSLRDLRFASDMQLLGALRPINLWPHNLLRSGHVVRG